MSEIWGGLRDALALLLSGNPEVWQIIWLSLRVSLTATFVSLVLGVPIGAALALVNVPGRTPLLGAVNAGMGLPPVVAGLLVSLMLWRNGPFGALGLLYTPTAMIVAQAAIATPVVAGLTAAALRALDPRYAWQLRSLGASPAQTVFWLLREARVGTIAAVIVAFGAVISEVGSAMMVGGNIKGETRVLTTAAVLEVGRGNFQTAIALSFVLLLLTYAVALALTVLQTRSSSR